MNCYDCATHDMTRPAIGICHDCGAGVCTDHARIETKYLTRLVPLGMPVAVEPPARTIRCPTCDDANDAATHRHRAARPASHPT